MARANSGDEKRKVSNSTTVTSTSADNSEAALCDKLKEDEGLGGNYQEARFWWRQTRIHVALMGLAIAAVNCYAQATFCIAIVEMVLPAELATIRLEEHSTTHQTRAIDMLSCPIEVRYRDYYDSWRFPMKTTNASEQLALSSGQAGNSSSATSIVTETTTSQLDVSNRFDWDASQQGLLLGAFAIGTAPLQVAGGRLAEIYGSKWVLLAGCLGTALTNLTIPYIAHWSFLLLLVNRVLMGVSQAGMEPGLMCLLADWLTPKEAGFFISMLLFALCAGFFLGSLCSSFILALGHGWPLTYYVSGGLNLLVGLVWLLYADSWPRASKHICDDELHFIVREQEQAKRRQATRDQNIPASLPVVVPIKPLQEIPAPALPANQMLTQQRSGAAGSVPVGLNRMENNAHAPWLEMLSSRPVWAFIICKVSVRWCADVISNELPTYLANVLHLSIKVNGLLNSASSAIFAISSFLAAYLAAATITTTKGNNNNNNKTLVRKSFQSVANFGSALCLILMTKYDCNITLSMSMLLVLSCCLVMGTGGEIQIPYDMTSRYPGTLHGMACTLSVSGWLAPPLIGLVLADEPSSRYRWSIVWYSTAAINLIGGIVFVSFADARPQEFDSVLSTNTSKSKRGPECGDLELAKPISFAERDVHASNESRRAIYRASYFNASLSDNPTESSP